MRQSSLRRLGVMGGTFDPLHWAHLVMAEEAWVQFDLATVLFIPAGQPPHKADNPVSDAEHRYAMALLGTADNPAFEVTRMEIEKEVPSYSVDTLRTLRTIYGEDTEIYFILGADEALDLPKWHEAEGLPDLVTKFVTAPRPGFDMNELHEKLPTRFYDTILPLQIAPVEISATDLRERIASGKPIRYLVPDAVESYIRKYGLYTEGSNR